MVQCINTVVSVSILYSLPNAHGSVVKLNVSFRAHVPAATAHLVTLAMELHASMLECVK